MPPSEVKMLNFIAHLINSSRSSPRLPLPCLPDCNSHLMLLSRLPKIYSGGLYVCDNLSILCDIGPQALIALLYAVVPVVRVFIKWDVGALCTTVGCSLVPSSLLTVSTDTTGKQKYRIPLQRYGGGSQVSELSLFSPCLKVQVFFLF